MSIIYSFQDYTDDFMTLYHKIKKAECNYDLIVGVARGGLILGTHLSNVLNVPFLALEWSDGEGRRKEVRKPEILHALSMKQNVLVVDDIVDNGKTAHEIVEAFPSVDYASLIYNNINRYNFVPTFTSWTINREETPHWFKFWWEELA